MSRWIGLFALLACAPHGAELSAEPEPELPGPTDAPEIGPDGCDHDPPPWLTDDVPARGAALPSAPAGPGIPPADREARRKPEIWDAFVNNAHVEEPEATTACRSQHFTDGDDRPVATRSYARDARARTVTVREDLGTDGHAVARHTWAYDTAGALASFTYRKPRLFVCGKRVPAERIRYRYVYDRFGLHIRTDVDYDDDGKVDEHQDWRAIRYDTDGLPVLLVDFDRLGKPRVVQHLKWGDDGRLVERTVHNGRGELVEAERNEFGTYGQRTWHAEFAEGAGWKTSRMRYGDGGELVGFDTDVDQDCTADESTVVTYTDRGDVEARTTTAGGATTLRDDFAYDDKGRLRRFSRRRGEVRDAEFTEYSYDAAGRVTEFRIRQDRGRPGTSAVHTFDDHTKTTYDAEGRTTRQWLQRGTYGPQETVRWKYTCGRSYRRFPRVDPLDDPELAHHCLNEYV